MATPARTKQRRLSRYRSLHANDWTRIEAAIPRRYEVAGAAHKARGLSDPNRLALALIVRETGTICVTDLVDLTGIHQSVVSRHLIRLREAGLSETRRRGKLSLHSVPAPEVIAEEIVESLTAALEQFSAVAAELGGATNGDEPAVADAVEQLLPDEERRI